MTGNQIIRASAGTGKTFSLATRFIQLMLIQKTEPERIVALTFSRAAAQEIYTKLLERLWTAAASDENAAKEREILCAKLNAEDRARADRAVGIWNRDVFAGLLRKVLAVQHHRTIATLDSFILRIVRSFPLEMGFQQAVDVLDTYGEMRAVDEAGKSVLNREDDASAFVAAFKTATKGEFVRTCAASLREHLKSWRPFYLAHRAACDAWTVSSMKAALGIAERPQVPSDADCAPEGNAKKLLADFAKYVNGYAPDQPIFAKTKYGEMARFLLANPEATRFEYETDKGLNKICDCGEAGARYVREGLRYMFDVKFGRAVEVAFSKITLCRLVEGEYDASTRRRGQLTFSDFTDCQAVAEGDGEGAIELENLQFRFDSKYDHWALDEFQDTSELQWLCLKRLVREAAQPGGGRTVMTVGDLKQSIYTWRGGNDAPFVEMMKDWGEFRGENGEIVANDISYRYEKNTADFINRVFGEGNVRESGLLGPRAEPAVTRWLDTDCWMVHKADLKKNGEPKDGDFVEVIEVAKPEESVDDEGEDDDGETRESAALRILAPSVCTLVADLWRRHEEAKSTDTVGILVRNNADGAALAERLRSLPGVGLPVVWEGADSVLDAPVVKAVLELVKLAEYPEDTFGWQTVDVLFPIRASVFPKLETASGVSAEVSRMLSELGLARTLKEIVRRLRACASHPLDPRTGRRLDQLVRGAVRYERRSDASASLSDFVAFLGANAGRESSTSPHVIRILTIHRSKGLTLDHVVVPIPETGKGSPMDGVRSGSMLGDAGWALPVGSRDEVRINPVVAAVWDRAANEHVLEQLRLYYVALTRARKSTHVFVCRDPHEGCVQFRDLLLHPFRSDGEGEPKAYGRVVFQAGPEPAFGRKAGPAASVPDWPASGTDARVAHRSPSAAGGSHASGRHLAVASLFADDRESAVRKGVEAHAAYASIEWIDEAAPANEAQARILSGSWREAFVRTEETTGLWRERSYERLENGVWETGQFDRVVFTRTGATVYDFKTNARKPSESEEEFAWRMRETYAGQMAAYRTSLAALTGLASDRIACVLLLEATNAAVRADE